MCHHTRPSRSTLISCAGSMPNSTRENTHPINKNQRESQPNCFFNRSNQRRSTGVGEPSAQNEVCTTSRSMQCLPNHEFCSPCTSMARPKSASFTTAPFVLLARSRFSGCIEKQSMRQVALHTSHFTKQSAQQLGSSLTTGQDAAPQRTNPDFHQRSLSENPQMHV